MYIRLAQYLSRYSTPRTLTAISMAIRYALSLIALASLSFGFAVSRREAGPLCNLRVTPGDGGSTDPVAITVDLSYGMSLV